MTWHEYPKNVPPMIGFYLVACRDKLFDKKRVQMMKWYSSKNSIRWASSIRCSGKTVTHWMHLPLIPEESDV